MRVLINTSITAFLLVISINSFSQQHPNTPTTSGHGLVNWINFEEAQEKSITEPKPIIIDLYTDWCGWCKHMIKTTYSDPQIANYINANFYAIKFNAETQDTVNFLSQVYVNQGTGRSSHDLIKKVFRTSSYPTTFFAGPNFTNIQGAAGYLDPNKISPYLVYFKEDLTRYVAMQNFATLFEQTFQTTDSTHSHVNWQELEEILKYKKEVPDTTKKEVITNAETSKKRKKKKNAVIEEVKIEPRKKLIFISSNTSVSSKVMDSTTFTHPVIKNYIDSNFYISRLDVASRDTINFLGQKIANDGPLGTVHPFIRAMMDNQPNAPAILVLDEYNNRITSIPQYMTPHFFEAVLVFMHDDIYKTENFMDFFKNFKGKINP